jgi:hypothetical protein
VTHQRLGRAPVAGGEPRDPGEELGKPELGNPELGIEPDIAGFGETVGRPVFGFTPPIDCCPVRGSIVGKPVRGSVVVPVAGKPVRGSVGAFVGRPVRGSVGGGSVVLGNVDESDPLGSVDGKPVPGDVIGRPVRGSMVDDGRPLPGGVVVVCAPAVATAMPRMPIASVVHTHAFMTIPPVTGGLSKPGAADCSG